jgi:hypothetical protein
MTSKDLIKKLNSIKDLGFIEAKRRGPTAIGHLIEEEMGLTETNLPIPDIGGRVEIKATRKNASSLITLFTFNRGVWRLKQKDLIMKYGYLDETGRPSLYITVNSKPNKQGFYLSVNKEKGIIQLHNSNQKDNIAEWSSYVIAGKFMTKFDRLVLILADSIMKEQKEFFHFNEAYILENPTPERFLESFEKNLLMIDIRMHIKHSGGVRNHGTGFRISESNLMNLYIKKQKVL